MTDYSELVKKLRDLHRDPRPASAVWLFDNQIALYDAAAAIEDLQYEIRESMQKCAECGDANMPKRGEIVRCRECLHYNAGFECLVEGYGIERDPDWFCGDGKRKVQE